MLLTRNKDLIKDKVILDLACANGVFSYPCLALGARRVVGVEVQQSDVDDGIRIIETTGFKDKMEFVHSNLFDYLTTAPAGGFDTILCFGFLYHTPRQLDFFREIKRIGARHVIIDTVVVQNYIWYGLSNLRKKEAFAPCLRLFFREPGRDYTTELDGVVYWPTCSYLEAMFNHIGYDCQRIPYRRKEIGSWSGMENYRKKYRVSYVGHKRQ
jgi:SAM-dependent methyltransferase